MANAFLTFMHGAGAVFAGVKTAFVWFLFASPLIGALLFIMMMKKYKNAITLRQRTKGDTDKVIQTKFMIVRKKGEPEQIRTMKRRLLLPIPPDDATDILENGAWYCEGYLTEGGQVTWIKADAKRYTEKEIKEHRVPIPGGKTHTVKEAVEKEKIRDVKLIRLSTQDKSFYFNREKMANDKYQVHGFWDFVNRNAGIIGLVMVIFVLFLFWGDIMEPAIEAKRIDQQRLSLEKEIVIKLDQLLNDRQVIRDEGALNTTDPRRAPE